MPITSLSDELNTWYENNCVQGNLSWKVLAKKTGITVSNITKIARGEVTRPKYETARVLLAAILPGRADDIAEYIALTYQGGQITFAKEHESPRKQLTEDTQDLFRDALTFRLFKLSMSGKRTVASLERDFGVNQITPRLDSLVRDGVVAIDDQGRLCRALSSTFTFGSGVMNVATEFKHGVDLIAEKKVLAAHGNSTIEKEANRLISYSSSLKPESAKNMRADFINVFRKVVQKYSEPEHRGDVEVFYNIAIGRYDAE